jgi:hypothetical protein
MNANRNESFLSDSRLALDIYPRLGGSLSLATKSAFGVTEFDAITLERGATHDSTQKGAKRFKQKAAKLAKFQSNYGYCVALDYTGALSQISGIIAFVRSDCTFPGEKISLHSREQLLIGWFVEEYYGKTRYPQVRSSRVTSENGQSTGLVLLIKLIQASWGTPTKNVKAKSRIVYPVVLFPS